MLAPMVPELLRLEPVFPCATPTTDVEPSALTVSAVEPVPVPDRRLPEAVFGEASSVMDAVSALATGAVSLIRIVSIRLTL